MNEPIKYDLYKRPNGLLYRVQLHSALHEPAELLLEVHGWWESHYTIGAVISSSTSTLVARNVVFKD